MQHIDIGFEKVEKILHIADIHIRNYKRHKEYRSIFRELYKAVKALPKNSIVYIGGDIVHNKTDISPELIDITSEFLKKLADLRPTIVIKGNHDTNLNNDTRLDTLSPIINTLNHDNLYYLDKTDVYKIGDCNFSVFEISDDSENYIRAKDIEGDNKIALFHGAIDSSFTDAGFKVSNKNHNVSMFDGYDLVLLGDIHKRQYLNKEKTFSYVGSLIQQNFGEYYENHGYLVWDVEKRKATEYNIKNEYGFFTVNIEDGKITNDISNIPKYPRIRFKTKETTQAQLKEILKELRKQIKVQDVIIIKDDGIRGSSENSGSKRITKDVRSIDYQNELIEEYLSKNYVLPSNILDEIHNINRTLNSSLSDIEVSRYIDWKPVKFSFSNMFSYGSNNVVDFDKMNGLIGIFAQNHIGKSALLDSLAFCLFDRCNRGKKADDIMNTNKSTFHCKLHFQVEGVDYFIERKAKRRRNNTKVRVDVNFWYIDEGGLEVSLNGEQRRDTDKNIRGIVGEYDDFVLTALSVQNNNTGFIEKTQTERKELLSQFLDITVFEELYQLANEDIKEVQVLLKDFKKTDYDSELTFAEEELSESKVEYKKTSSEVKKSKGSIKKLNSNIKKLHGSLRKVKKDLDIKELESSKENLELEAVEDLGKLSKYKDYTEVNKVEYKKHRIGLSSIDIEKAKADQKNYLADDKVLQKLNSKLKLLKAEVKNAKEKIDAIGTFDPNCDFCKNNSFVKSAERIKLQIEQYKIDYVNLSTDISNQNEKIEAYGNFEDLIDEYAKLEKKISTIQVYQSEIKVKTVTRKANIKRCKSEIRAIDKDIKKYYENEESILFNNKVNVKIDASEKSKGELEELLQTQEQTLLDNHATVTLWESKVININETIEKAHKLENKLKSYEYYMEAIKRDGIPYEIISEVLPYIQDEVNNILSQMVDFTIDFDVDGKNVLTNICYNGNCWPLELTSGMEKFISSLAIRVALINVSNLPRPNFLAIDEGFGTLDSENLNSMENMFEYLKSEFDYIIIISHIETLKDLTDDLIEIAKKGEFSTVLYS
tara:strand:+ start:1772 stop:4918 length:3147 start_codon:yes stop_codon:yes gene_type:complete